MVYAIGLQELIVTVEARAIWPRTAPVPVDLGKLLPLQKDSSRVLLPEVHNWLVEEEAEVEAALLAVRVLLTNQNKGVLQPEFTR